METLTKIVKGTEAKLTHICNGRAYYRIETEEHVYQLEINTLDAEWKDVYVLPKYKAITLMRWIRESLEKKDDKLVLMI
jgi:hypothetical protein